MVKFVAEENPNRQPGNMEGTDNHKQNYRSKRKEARSPNLTLSVQPSDSNITEDTSDFKLSAIQECTDRSEDIYINAIAIARKDFQRTEDSGLNNDYLLLNPSETDNLKTATPDESEIHLKSLAYYKVHGCSKEELNEICRSEENFKGWLTKDEIKSGLEEGSYLIENQVPGVKMKHCTVLHVEKDHYEYFDSNGDIFTENIGIPVNSNQKKLQHQGYNTCGLHATHFLKERYKLGSMKKVQESYPTDNAEMLQLNEDHVYEYTKEKRLSESAPG